MEFIIQGITPPLRAWNLSFLRVREFILPPGQGIYPPSGSGNLSCMEFILPSMNVSFREFLLPSGQGIYHSENYSSPPGMEFILPPGQGIYPPSGSGNLSSREFLLPSGRSGMPLHCRGKDDMNFSMLLNFLWMKFSIYDFLPPMKI